jgi:hypothetical protein
MAKIILFKTGERPDIKLWLEDDDGTLINFASGYTFVFKVGLAGSAAVYTKSTNITGAAGAGAEPDGTPNVTMTFTAGELDSVAASPGYTGQLRATNSSLDRLFQFPVEVKDVIT